MEKLMIKHDFYESAGIIRNIFNVNIAESLITGATVRSHGDTAGVVQSVCWHDVMESLGISDNVGVVNFIYEILNGIRIVGKYIYRRNKNGLEILSGTTIISERDGH